MLSTRRVLLVPFLVVLLLVPPAEAQFAPYDQGLVEHDDQGRSDEPDARTTSVLGPALSNCVLALNPLITPGLGRGCLADSALPPAQAGARAVAPGCTDDTGRQPSGLCALHTQGVRTSYAPDGTPVYAVPPGTFGVAGMAGTRAPGAYTPSKSTTVRLFDLRVTAALPAAGYADVNHKLADTGLASALRALGTTAGAPLVPPLASAWAWYGLWTDLNGNGVLDHRGDNRSRALPGNEFRWVGNCGGASTPVCLREPVVVPLWVYPGNHHQECGFLIGCYAPADVPGRAPLCWTLWQANREAELFRCLPGGDFDAEQRWADPLFGADPDRLTADETLDDRTGDAAPDTRLWQAGVNPAYYYDQSLLTTTLTLAGPTLKGRDDGLATSFDLAALQFVDVDRYERWVPVLGDLLQTTLRPSARTSWLLVRDSFEPASVYADGQAHQRTLDAPSHGVGAIDDRVRDPGWSREPNTALDRFPGARHGAFAPLGDLPASEQRHRGWLNDDAAHRSGWHAYADVKAERVAYTYGKWVPGHGVGGGYYDAWSVLPAPGAPLRAEGDHGRSLDPGLHQWRGFVGAWRDVAHPMEEVVLDPAGTVEGLAAATTVERYLLPPDGWVGNVVNTTGAYRYRGYGHETCPIAGQVAARAWAVCHPYLDADSADADAEAGLDQSFGVDLSDPQDYLDETEFQRLTTPPSSGAVVLRPAGGTWTVPVFVWRDFYDTAPGNPAMMQDLTGTSAPILLRTLEDLPLSHRSRVLTKDFLLLPLGNQGLAVTSEFALQVRVTVPTRGIAVDEPLADVDVYRPWGA